MSLSEREQRLLHEIERTLAADDPRLAARLRPEQRPSVRVAWLWRARTLALVGVLGLVVLLAGAVAAGAAGAAVAVTGSVMMIAAVIAALANRRRRHSPHSPCT